MPRKFTSTEDLQRPDPRYGDPIISKFINCLMQDGKKTTAQKIFYDALAVVASRIKDKEPHEVFLAAVNNIKPRVEVRSKRVGGATYQVPMEVSRKRQLSLAIRWLLSTVRNKKGRPAHRKLADEVVAAYRGEGEAIKKREDTHRMAEANKAFAHFAW
jgi:small subunit ribosomal protein S7